MRPALTRLSRSAAAALLVLGIPALSSAAAKETERVEKTVPFPANGTLKLKNFSGSVEITMSSTRKNCRAFMVAV